MKKYNFAFTLAEVLVVLGIIGVVSALTLPNLTQTTGDKEVITKVKKEYSSVDEALNRAKAKYGSNFATWYRGKTTTADRSLIVGRRLAEFMNVDVDCAQTSNTQCFSSSNITNYDEYSTITTGPTVTSGPTVLGTNTTFYKFKLKDGSDIAVRCIADSEYSIKNGYIINPMCIVVVDVDGGKKGYNQYGRDIFQLTLKNNGMSYRSYTYDSKAASCKNCVCGSLEACSTAVIKYDSTKYYDEKEEKNPDSIQNLVIKELSEMPVEYNG